MSLALICRCGITGVLIVIFVFTIFMSMYIIFIYTGRGGFFFLNNKADFLNYVFHIQILILGF